jgi:hypothetical protein
MPALQRNKEENNDFNIVLVQQISIYFYDLKLISCLLSDSIARETSSIERYIYHPFFINGS